ncbi:MAG TPA: hypothetical protein VIF34_08210 [Methylocystis sp.]
MTDQLPETPAQQPVRDRKASAGAKSKRTEAPPVEPALTAYFGKEAIPAGPFLKAVRGAKLQRFMDDDIRAASVLAAETDPTGSRLLALAAMPVLPKAVERWIWPEVRAFLRAKVPAAFEPFDPDADVTFRRIHREVSPALNDSDQQRRQRGETLFMLALTWLGTQRTLDVVTTLDALRDMFPGTDISVRETVRKGLVSGKLSEVKRTAAVVTLMGRALKESQVSLDMERQRRAGVEARLAKAQAQISGLFAQNETLTQERDRLASELAAAKRALEESQQHAGHDIVELRAQQTLLLKRRIGPLLSDAVDALEIEPPAPQIAIKRLKTAIVAIEETTR